MVKEEMIMYDYLVVGAGLYGPYVNWYTISGSRNCGWSIDIFYVFIYLARCNAKRSVYYNREEGEKEWLI